MSAQAHLVHRARGRLRLRIPERRHNPGFFADLERRLSGLPGITGVSANPATAGVLILSDPSGAIDPLAGIEATGLVRLVDPPAPPTHTVTALRRAATRIDRALDTERTGIWDLRSVTVVLVLALAVRQMARGQVMVPAASLLWYAYELVRHAPSAPTGRQGPDDPERG